MVNYHTYASALAPWSLQKEIEALVAHLKDSVGRSAGENQLWKYFSLSQRAQLAHPKPSDEALDRLAMLSQQVEGLSRKLDSHHERKMPGLAEEIRKRIHGCPSKKLEALLLRLRAIAQSKGAEINLWELDNSVLELHIVGYDKLSTEDVVLMQYIASEDAFALAFEKSLDPPAKRE